MKKYTVAPPCKKFLFCIFLVFVFFIVTAQTRAPNEGKTFYYKQTGVVRNNQKSVGDNTGQFITFTHAGCYDSNKDRQDVGNGFMAYKGENVETRSHAYSGRSYWGEQSHYYFFNNFDRINIYAPDGVIYVYERTTAPAGVVTCAKIYVKPAPDSGYIGSTPPVVGPTSPDNSWDIQPGTITRVKCSTCNGSTTCKNCTGGLCSRCHGTGKVSHSGAGRYTGDYILTRDNCTSCYGSGKCNICRGSGKCLACNGKGYF